MSVVEFATAAHISEPTARQYIKIFEQHAA
jgi:hypothetical protein